jgi:ankyrin repeat protein
MNPANDKPVSEQKFSHFDQKMNPTLVSPYEQCQPNSHKYASEHTRKTLKLPKEVMQEYFAFAFGQKEVIETLIKNELNPNEPIINYLSNNLRTELPLCILTQYDYKDLAQYLLDHKANPFPTVKDNRTPLVIAASLGNTNCLRLLLKQDTLTFNRKKEALEYCLEAYKPVSRYKECLKLLIRYSEDTSHAIQHIKNGKHAHFRSNKQILFTAVNNRKIILIEEILCRQGISKIINKFQITEEEWMKLYQTLQFK